MDTELTVDQIEWFDDRYYRVLAKDGEKFFPSVTTILGIINKPFLSRWRGDVGNYEADRKMNFAAWRGSRIHDAIHQLLSLDEGGNRAPLCYIGPSGKPQYTQEEWLHIIRFSAFYDMFTPTVHESELVVYSERLEYAGTCDLLCDLKAGEYKIGERTKVTVPENGLYLGDIKTGREIDDEYHFQTAAYAGAVEEMQTDKKISGTFIIHTGSSTKAGWNIHIRSRAEMLDDMVMFGHALNLFKRKNPNGTPKIFTMPATITLVKQELQRTGLIAEPITLTNGESNAANK